MEYRTSAPIGRDLLSERKPGWFRGFSLDDFDINCIFRCVLAKVFGNYSKGLVELFGEDYAWNTVPEEHGFTSVDGNGDRLQSEWIHIITELQLSEEEK